MKEIIAAIAAVVLLSSCSSRYAYTNKPLPVDLPVSHSHASFDIRDDRGNKDVLFMLALSGGGSRSAYFSASVMLKLQEAFPDLDLLKEVDVISSVSGGSLPAAYYAISRDTDGYFSNVSCRVDCAAFRTFPNISCDLQKRQLGFRGSAVPAEREALLAACPDERARIEMLYELSLKGVRSNRVWDRETVEDLVSRNYIGKWTANWFLPTNIGLYWFTAYDRSDIMAKTFEDNMYDVSPGGSPLTFADLNPERPYLILNAASGTDSFDGLDFGDIFTFTDYDFFHYLRSDISRYSVARAVMASAAFPAVFNYMTLADFRSGRDDPYRFLHLFDGGNADNLGLVSLQRLINKTQERYRHYVVVLVDAFVKSRGEDSDDPDPRRSLSYFVDSNFMDGFDSLLSANRDATIADFVESGKSLTFWHLTFEKIGKDEPDIEPQDPGGKKRRSLALSLNRIPTQLKISGDDRKRISRAVDLLFENENDRNCLNRIREIVAGREPGEDTCDSRWAREPANP